MKCSFCVVIASVLEESRAAFAAHVVSDESILRHYAGLFLDSLKRPDYATIVKEARRGTLMTERCARLIEMGCKSCGLDTCIPCYLASEIRKHSDEMYAARDLELAEEALDDLADRLIEEVCNEHRLFGDMMREEQCRRQTWELLEKGARK